MLSTADYQEALEPVARKSFFLGVKEIPAELNMFYDVVQTDMLTETYMQTGDIGAMGDFSGSVDFDHTQQGYTGTITAVEKAKGMKIQRKFLRTDQLDIARSEPKKLGLAGRRRIATDIFYPFNHAFDGLVTTPDGANLCSASHTTLDENGSTQSNLGSSSFSAVNLIATRVLMRKFLTSGGQKFEVMPKLIVCGANLESDVWEALNSIGRVDTALNNKNFLSSMNWDVVSTVWLDDTNDWFVIDPDLMKEYLKWNVLDKLDFKQADEFSSFAALYAAYMFYGFGATGWEWIYGHQVG